MRHGTHPNPEMQAAIDRCYIQCKEQAIDCSHCHYVYGYCRNGIYCQRPRDDYAAKMAKTVQINWVT